MLFRQSLRIIGVLSEIVPVGVAIAEENVHDGTGQRAVGAGPEDVAMIGLLHGAGVIDVNHRELGAAGFPRDAHMGHHVHLRVHRIAAPHHDEVGLLHLAGVNAAHCARARRITRPGSGDTQKLPYMRE